MNMKKKIRKKIFVNFPIQYKIAALTIVGIVLPTAIMFVLLAAIISTLIQTTQVSDELVYSALMFITNKIYVILGFGFCGIILLFAAWSSIFMHRITGPLYRFEKILDDFLNGKDLQKVKFRKHDYYSSLAEKFNKTVEKIKNKTN